MVSDARHEYHLRQDGEGCRDTAGDCQTCAAFDDIESERKDEAAREREDDMDDGHYGGCFCADCSGADLTADND